MKWREELRKRRHVVILSAIELDRIFTILDLNEGICADSGLCTLDEDYKVVHADSCPYSDNWGNV